MTYQRATEYPMTEDLKNGDRGLIKSLFWYLFGVTEESSEAVRPVRTASDPIEPVTAQFANTSL
jgi:hypothetical protein